MKENAALRVTCPAWNGPTSRLTPQCSRDRAYRLSKTVCTA